MTSGSSGSATATVSAPSAKSSGSTSWRCASGDVDERGRVGLGRGVAQVDDRHVQLLAERAGHVVFADHALLDEQGAEPGAVGVLDHALERIAGDDPGVHEQVAEAHAGRGGREVGHERGGR